MSETNATTPIKVSPLELDDVRIHERSRLMYFRLWGDGYKGHYRGALTGVLVGALAGAAMGGALCLLPIAGVTVGAFSIIASFAAFGALIAGEGMSNVGTVAATLASSLAEKHARINDPMYKGKEFDSLNDELMSDGREYHYEFPATRDDDKIFFWKSGLVGAGIIGALGALAGKAMTAGELLTPVAKMATLPLFAAHPIGVAALGFGIIGLTFGINRSIFKSIFNQTDANLSGKLHDGIEGPDLGKMQQKGKETDHELEVHRLRRQEEISELQRAYNQKIYEGASEGLFKGFAGGMTVGALVGGFAGLVAFGAICALTGGWPLGGLLLFGNLTGLFAGVGSALGAALFAQSCTQAGGVSVASAVDEEFRRNYILKSQGITPPAPRKVEGRWINPKAMVIAGTLGLAVGAVIAPHFGPLLLKNIFHLATVTDSLTSAGILASSAVGGLVGASFGLGSKVWESVRSISEWVYDKSYFRDTSNPIEGHVHAPQEAQKTAEQARETKKSCDITTEELSTISEKQNSAAAKNFSEVLTKPVATSQAMNLGRVY